MALQQLGQLPEPSKLCVFERADADLVCRECGFRVPNWAAEKMPFAVCVPPTPPAPSDPLAAITINVEPQQALCRAGTELKRLLKTWLRIEATPNCACNQRARLMDERGCDWCEQNADEIVGWLREEAEKRKLPFMDAAGKLLVRRAIAAARKIEKLTANAAPPPSSDSQTSAG